LFNLDANIAKTKECMAPESNNTRAVCPIMQVIPFTMAFDAQASYLVKAFIFRWALGCCTED